MTELYLKTILFDRFRYLTHIGNTNPGLVWYGFNILLNEKQKKTEEKVEGVTWHLEDALSFQVTQIFFRGKTVMKWLNKNKTYDGLAVNM